MIRIIVVLVIYFMPSLVSANDEIAGLKAAISETPLSAVIEPLSYRTSIDKIEQLSKTQLKAKVLEPLRGRLSGKITIQIVSEIGDESIGDIGSRLIIALCKDEIDLYFAGVGTVFDATDNLVKVSKAQLKELGSDQSSYGYCD